MVLIALWRAALTILYRNRNAHAALTAKTLGFWELNYAICALTQAAAFGALCFITMVSTNDPIGQLLVDATTIGYTAGVTARNTGRLRVAIGQLTLALGPLTAGATLRGGLEYYSLALLTFLYFLAAVEIAGYLSRKNLRLLLLNHENKALISNLAEQHRRLDIALGNMSHGLCTFDSSLRLVLSNERTAELFGLPPESFPAGNDSAEMVALSVEAAITRISPSPRWSRISRINSLNAPSSSTIELKGERTVSWSHVRWRTAAPSSFSRMLPSD